MTWQQVLQLLIAGGGAGAVIVGLLLTINGATRTRAIGDGALKEKVGELERRVGTMETDVRELTRALAEVARQVAVLPEQLKGLRDVITLQHEQELHSSRNLRATVEALARRQGVIAGPDA